MLSSKERQNLKAQAHHQKPVVQIGKKGLTDGIVGEVSRALTDHELIKVKFAEYDDTPENDAGGLAGRTDSEVVAVTGAVAILYRPHPEKPKVNPRKK